MLSRLVNFGVQIARIIIFYTHSMLHFVKVFILYKTNKPLFAATNQGESAKISANKIVVIAAFPKDDLLYRESIENQLAACKNLQLHPIYVSNGPIPQNLQKILVSYGATSLQRQNRGRDFGAYQSALAWIEQNVETGNLDNIFLSNDTLYYLNPLPQRGLPAEKLGCSFKCFDKSRV